MSNPIDGLVMCCCGYCGQPTNDKGEPLEFIPDNFDLPKAEMVHGLCCAAQSQHENESRIVTKEMAYDAGMPDVEGMQY